VTGVELSGSSFAVSYADGTTQTAEVFGAGGPGAGRAVAQEGIRAAPVLTLAGAHGGELLLEQGTQTLAIDGQAGADVRVLLLTGDKQNVPASDAFDANTAIAVQYRDVTLDAAGHAQLDLSLPQGHPLIVLAAGVDAQGNAASLVSERLVLALAPPASAQGATTASVVDGSLVFAAPAMTSVHEHDALAALAPDPAASAPVPPASETVSLGSDWHMLFDPDSGSLLHVAGTQDHHATSSPMHVLPL
jgi:hypothetical protein